MKSRKNWAGTLLLGVLLITGCTEEIPGNGDANEVNIPELWVSSFNIRFDNPSDGSNSWDSRKENVYSFLALKEPDIMGLQEVLHGQLEYLEKKLPSYERVGVGRDDGETRGEYAPILYKRNRFQLIDSGNFWLSETPSEPSVGWDALIKRICTYVVLEDKESDEQIHFYNTHFSHVGPEARSRSAQLIIDSIQAISRGSRVILTGDLNTRPNSSPYNIIIESGMKDSYDSRVSFGPVGTYNGFDVFGPHTRRIDYVFFNGFSSKKYVTSSELIDRNYLSDHFPVSALLEYRALE